MNPIARFAQATALAARPHGEDLRQDGDGGFRGRPGTEVEPGRPAAKAGLRPGDLLVFLDGKPVKNVDEVHRLLDSNSIGRPLQARALRNGVLLDYTVVPDEG